MRSDILGRRCGPLAVSIAFVLTVAAITVSTPGASAATCADAEVSAKGEVASFKWLALVKARGNWRSKVRTIPKLGADYANYGRAENQVERCISDQRSTVCTVTARPCRP